ncbi:MAG: hypothetical protein ACI9XP_001858, partial [Lentimonas sp.]
RTEKLSLIALMVLRHKPWESKSMPLLRTPLSFCFSGFFYALYSGIV